MRHNLVKNTVYSDFRFALGILWSLSRLLCSNTYEWLKDGWEKIHNLSEPAEGSSTYCIYSTKNNLSSDSEGEFMHRITWTNTNF